MELLGESMLENINNKSKNFKDIANRFLLEAVISDIFPIRNL